MPIRMRVAVYVTLSFAAVIAVLSYTLTELYKGYSYRTLDVTLQAAASSVANRVAEGDFGKDIPSVKEDIDETVAPFENRIGLIHVRIFDGNWNSILSFNDDDSIAYRARKEIALKGKIGRKFLTLRTNDKKYRFAYGNFETDDSSQGTVVALSSLAPFKESIDRIRELAFIVGPITIMLVGIGSVTIAKRALKPLGDMADKMDRIEADSPTMKLSVPATNDEIERVVLSFNSLMDRISNLMESQRNFLMDASHELKTPLTVIQTEIEMLLMNKTLTADEKSDLQHLVSEVEYASKLAVDLIYLSRLESSSPNMVPVNAGEIVREVVNRQAHVAKNRGVSLRANIPADLVLQVDPELFRRALSNVVENAIRYSGKGGNVVVSGDKVDHPSRGMIAVEDDGPGINPDELSRVFDRFYRTKSARGGDEKGSGLGLSITRRIIEQHGGSVDLKSAPDKGTLFLIYVPIPQE